MGPTSSSSKSSPLRSKPSDFRHNKARMGPPTVKPLFSVLPTEWLIILLSEWMDIKDVAKLDIAMTNHSYRAAFLHLLEKIRSTSVDGRYGPDSFQKLSWLSRRQIYVENVDLDRLEIDQLKSVKLVTLRKLILRDVDDLRVLNATINCPFLQSLDIDNSYTPSRAENNISNLGVVHVGSVLSTLEHFRLISRSTITGDRFLTILQGCQMLKTIDLDCGILESFTASEIENLQPFGHLFTTLDFTGTLPSVGRPSAFAGLLAHCPNLKKLSLGNVRDPEYSHEGKEESLLATLGRHCPLVEEIDLNCTFHCPDAGLLLLSQNCVHVRMINFHECGGITDTSLAHISQIRSLQELSIEDCDMVTDAGLAVLFQGCPNLQSLHILGGDISEQGFRGLRNGPCSQNLVTIYLWLHNDALTPAFEVIMGESLACCHNLETFTLHYYADVSFGDAGLALMCEGCPKLKDLTLVHGETLTIDGLMHAASTCPLLHEIRVVIFGGDEEDLEGFTEADVEIFETRFPSVELHEDFY